MDIKEKSERDCERLKGSLGWLMCRDKDRIRLRETERQVRLLDMKRQGLKDIVVD